MASLMETLVRRWMPFALVASLGANMFLLGFVVGHPPPPPPPPRDVERIVERLSEALPPADAAILRRVWDASRVYFPDGLGPPEDFPRRLQAALRRDPFDPAELVAIFAETDRSEQAKRERLQKGLIQAASEMSREGRNVLASFRPR